MPTSIDAARAELAPTGVLRAGLNFSNFLITKRDPATGAVGGVAADLANEIGRRLGVPVQFVGYETPGKMADAAQSGVWDIAFLGAEPLRAQQIDFSAAYLEIEATYLVPAGSKVQSVDEVDRAGMRISVSNKSAYELYLTRSLKNAELIKIDGADASFDVFVAEKMDALAGLRPRLVTEAEKLPGSRVLPGRFTAIQQAIGTAKGPNKAGAGAAYLRAFVEEAKASGLVARALAANGVRGATVAPLA
jgi:polar amino acid transport system substrate-binding protein